MAPFDLALVLDTLERLSSSSDPAELGQRARALSHSLVEATLADASLEHRTAALRAWVELVERQLGLLVIAERELPPRFWADAGRVKSARDLADLLGPEIHHLRVVCSQPTPAPRDVDERLRAMIALATAEQHAMKLGRHAEVACVLAAGASIGNEQFRCASRTLAALLGLALAPLPTGVPRFAAGSADEDACHAAGRRSMVR